MVIEVYHLSWKAIVLGLVKERGSKMKKPSMDWMSTIIVPSNSVRIIRDKLKRETAFYDLSFVYL